MTKKLSKKFLNIKNFIFITFISIFSMMAPLFSFFETKSTPAWEVNIVNSTLLFSEQGGVFTKLPDTTYGRTLNLIEIIDPNLFGVNNLRLDGKTINFRNWEGELGYWEFFNYNFGLGAVAKLQLFQNGWKVLQDTYNTRSHPTLAEIGEFNGNQYGIGPFIAFTPTDELLFKFIYRYSYQHYSFTTDWPTDFIQPEPHSFHRYEHRFISHGNLSLLWNYRVRNRTYYMQNTVTDNFFGYQANLYKFNQQLFNQFDFQTTYQHYYFTQTMSTGLIVALDNPTYIGKSVFNVVRDPELSMDGALPKSVPVYSAWMLNLGFRTQHLFGNLINFIASSSVTVFDQDQDQFLQSTATHIGGEVGLVIFPDLKIFQNSIIIAYSFGYRFDTASREQIVAVYITPKSTLNSP